MADPNKYIPPGGCIEQCTGRGFKFAALLPKLWTGGFSAGQIQIRCYCTQQVGKLSRKATEKELKAFLMCADVRRHRHCTSSKIFKLAGSHVSMEDRSSTDNRRSADVSKTRGMEGMTFSYGGKRHCRGEDNNVNLCHVDTRACMLPLIEPGIKKRVTKYGYRWFGKWYKYPNQPAGRQKTEWKKKDMLCAGVPKHTPPDGSIAPWLSSGVLHFTTDSPRFKFGVSTVYRTPLPFKEPRDGRAKGNGNNVVRVCDSTTAGDLDKILSCPKRQSLKIKSAWYGRSATAAGLQQYLCGGKSPCSKRVDVQKQVKRLCDGYQKCQFSVPAQLGSLELTCKKGTNYLDVQYSCTTNVPKSRPKQFEKKRFAQETEKAVVNTALPVYNSHIRDVWFSYTLYICKSDIIPCVIVFLLFLTAVFSDGCLSPEKKSCSGRAGAIWSCTVDSILSQKLYCSAAT